MKQLQVEYISADQLSDDEALVSARLNLLPKHSIGNLLWSNNGYKPKVSFSIAYTPDIILLKYFVEEKYIKAAYHEPNDPVFKDTCVEMFIAFNDDSKYYNLEFNCIGTVLIAYGGDKDDRVYLDKSLIETISSYYIILPPDNNGSVAWELTLRIPFTLFAHHNITSLKDMACRANFYKCGDDLPEPHFLSWNNINYPEPNFHLPGFFGTVHFA
jgi:Carbohydrate-binding family 9